MAMPLYTVLCADPSDGPNYQIQVRAMSPAQAITAARADAHHGLRAWISGAPVETGQTASREVADEVRALREVQSRHAATVEWRGSSRRTLLLLVMCPVVAIAILLLIAIGLKVADAAEGQGPTPTNPNYGR